MKRFFSYIAIALLLFWAAVSMMPNLQQTFLYISVIGAFVCSFFAVSNVSMTKEFILFVVLCIWMLLTVLWAENQTVALRQVPLIIGVLVFSWSIQRLSNDEKLVPWLYVAWIIYLVSILLYIRTHSVGFDYSLERFEDEQINANTPSYYVFFSTFAFFILSELRINKKLIKLCRVLFLLMIPLTLYVAFLSGARQVIIIQVPFIAFLMYYRYLTQVSSSTKTIFIISIIVASVYLLTMSGIDSYFQNSLLYSRMETNLSDDQRTILIKQAIDVGNSHLFGIGLNNFQLHTEYGGFSHCSYTEVYANCGFIGALLLFLIVLSFIKKQWNRYKLYKDKHYAYFFVFGVLYAIYNLFYVFYLSPWLWGFFMLVSSHSDLYLKKNNRININTIR